MKYVLRDINRIIEMHKEGRISEEERNQLIRAVEIAAMKKQVRKWKNPAIAVLLSVFVPGTGQIYNGQIGKGILIFISAGLIIPYIFGIFDAYLVAQKMNRNEKMPEKSPSVAALLGFFVPGGGQFYNREIGKGTAILYSAILIVPWVYGIFEAYSTAEKINCGTIRIRLTQPWWKELFVILSPGIALMTIAAILGTYTIINFKLYSKQVFIDRVDDATALSGYRTNAIRLGSTEHTYKLYIKAIGENVDEDDFSYHVKFLDNSKTLLWAEDGSSKGNRTSFNQPYHSWVKRTVRSFRIEKSGEFYLESSLDREADSKGILDEVEIGIIERTNNLKGGYYVMGIVSWLICCGLIASWWNKSTKRWSMIEAGEMDHEH